MKQQNVKTFLKNKKKYFNVRVYLKEAETSRNIKTNLVFVYLPFHGYLESGVAQK